MPRRVGMFVAALLYTLLWCVAGPLLFVVSSRFREGWQERLGLHLPRNCHLWIQGASAGECRLTETLAPRLAPWSVLGTTCTKQGRDVLSDIAVPHVQARMLPLDLPPLMWWALCRVRPKVVVLLETELWPGLLMACRWRHVPVVILNARMSTHSLPGYLLLSPLLRSCAPETIGAIAEADARRYDTVFGTGTAVTTGNIKFDRALAALEFAQSGTDSNPLSALIPADRRFIVLGSVREEEEGQVRELVRELRRRCPECIIGLCPRHMHRIPAWQAHLHSTGVLRSTLNGPALPGSIILWDVFGELPRAYALANAAFVGGSLARLGGQNFLEPLACGIPVCVGPWTRNFDWVGKEIFDKLVLQTAYTSGLAGALLSSDRNRPARQAAARDYIQARSGATEASLLLLHTYLPRSPHV